MKVSLALSTLLWAYAHAQSGSESDERNNITEPRSNFVSRPDLTPLALNVSIQNSDPVTGYQPGFIFISPYLATQTGPHIYDKAGNLVWSGYNQTEQELERQINTHSLQPCSYRGSLHLCMWKGHQRSGSGWGEGLIMNENYEFVQTLQTGEGTIESDMHDVFPINDGETALLLAYNPIEYDLSAYDVDSDPQWLIEGMFQEINVTTGEVLFEWHSIDHVDLSASYVPPGANTVSGDGSNEMDGWDYFHINSVDKSPTTGNYIISARHTSGVYAIDGSDGSVLWTLSYGAENNSFHHENFNFTFQHDARWLQENDTHTVISLFDNGSDDSNHTSTESFGLIISIDHEAEAANLLQRVAAPRQVRPNGIHAGSQCNFQVFENGGAFVGWGSVPAVTETNPAGEHVLHAEFGSWINNYRAYAGNWTGRPLDSPALVAPAQAENTTTQLVAYFSWNGATEIRTWKIWGSGNEEEGFEELGSVEKEGFETRWESEEYTPFIFVEALDANDDSLGNSSIVGVSRLSSNGSEIEPSSTPTQASGPEPTETGEEGAAMRTAGDAGYTLLTAVVVGSVAVAFSLL